jgi:hypothetical protein
MMMIFGFGRRRRIGILLGFIKYLKIRNFYLYVELEIKMELFGALVME